MHSNEALIRRFYAAFQKLDYKTMNDCYSEGAIFNDPVFGILQNGEPMYMWEMLCRNAKDFNLTYSDIELLDEEYATCNWIASYTFSKTGRKVVNHVKAHMRIEDGKITEHSDKFDLWKWSRQALGLPGLLLGWSNFIHSKVRNSAAKSLSEFISKNAPQQ
ncbi:MAG: nuclear transport factor 2 family protein [Gemmatimonadaceae bacterium]|nr:nuclear transport factor 2 family protein [Chitinophagaceae bacterium]